jgi:chromodomain-helicase-DNA-binding protein 4
MILIVDGVPKEGLRIQDVLVRIAVLLLIRDKVSLQVEIHVSLILL